MENGKLKMERWRFSEDECLQQFHRDPCAGLGIGEGVVMVFEVVTTGGRHGMQLVVRQLLSEMAA